MGKTFHSFFFFEEQLPQVPEGKATTLDPSCIENGWESVRESIWESRESEADDIEEVSVLCLGTSKTRKSNTQVESRNFHLALNLASSGDQIRCGNRMVWHLTAMFLLRRLCPFLPTPCSASWFLIFLPLIALLQNILEVNYATPS